MIEDVITLALERMRISGGDDLLGFSIDADYALAEQEAFASVLVTISEDVRSVVNGRIEVKDSVDMIQEVAQAFLQAWPDIAYPDFSSFAVQQYVEGTVLRFITAVPGGELCVTGTFIATSAGYQRLVDRFNTDYSKIVGPLRPMPGGLPKWAVQ